MLRTEIVASGTLDCFPPGLRDADGALVNVEVSAAVFDGRRLILASDKPIPGEARSAAFAVTLDGDALPQPDSLVYLTAAAIKNAIKYEDFALTVDGRHVLATTGFDRIAADSHALNPYNHLLIWPVGEPERVRVVDPDPRDGVEGSLELRRKLDAAIGLPYYKIEGLAAVPPTQASPDSDGLLLFGVREQGQAHDDFDYVCRVVGAHYRIGADDNLEFVDELCERYRFEPGDYAGVRHVCGLSSLEYDPYHARLYLMASFEIEEATAATIGGYLWALSLDDFAAGAAPAIVEDAHGEVLTFEHKAEGLAVIDRERLFVAYDNDRDMALGSIDARDERHACEAPYTVLRVSERA
ncbi:hypothetical protein GY26_16690 [Gammaproteobacteria bacterium MFB021]|nr:hypothetical protein GY26_16690 [Gammaproteobacteria bacterium MFB021]